MIKKLKCFFAVSLFLTVIFSTCLSAEAANLTNEKTTKETEKGGVDLLIEVYGEGPWGQTIPVPGVRVTVTNKDNPLITKTGITNMFGRQWFWGIIPDGVYYVNMKSGDSRLNTEIDYNSLNSYFSYSIESFTKSRNHIESMFLLENLFARFPLLQLLLNRPVFQQLP